MRKQCKTRSNGHKLELKRFCLNIRKHLGFFVQLTEHWHKLPERLWRSHSGEIFKSCMDMVMGNLPWLALLIGRSDKMTSRSPLQSQPFCDSVKQNKNQESIDYFLMASSCPTIGKHEYVLVVKADAIITNIPTSSFFPSSFIIEHGISLWSV